MDTSQLRVLFLVDAIRGRNGVGTYYPDLVEHLASHVARAELLCPCLSNPRAYQGFSVPIPGDATQRLFMPRFRRIWKIVDELSPHVIVVPIPGPFGLYGLWRAQRFGVPLCVAYQTDYEKLVQMYIHRLFARSAEGLLRFLNGIIFKRSSLVLAISRHMAARAESEGIRDVRLVGTPIGKEFLDKARTPMHPGVDRVLFVGRLAPEKNVDKVVEAAHRQPWRHFAIAGDGPLRRLVEDNANKLPNLEYLGWQTRGQVVDALDRSDMLVLPSSVEAFGTVVVEAMARERLVLASKGCGVMEWPSLASAIYTMEDGESVADSLLRIDKDSAATRIERARLGCQAAHTLNNQTVGQWLDFLAELADRGRALPASGRPVIGPFPYPAPSNNVW